MSPYSRRWIIGTAAWLAGCAGSGWPGGDCSDYTDPTTSATYRWCGDPQAFNDATPLRPAAELVSMLPVEERLGDVTSYLLRVRYQGQGWIYIAAGSQLQLSIDGQPLELASERGSRADSVRRLPSRYALTYQEAADFATDADTIRRLAGAEVVDFVLINGDKRVEGRLSSGNLAPFREFTATLLDR
jgi:hypothetical protein